MCSLTEEKILSGTEIIRPYDPEQNKPSCLPHRRIYEEFVSAGLRLLPPLRMTEIHIVVVARKVLSDRELQYIVLSSLQMQKPVIWGAINLSQMYKC